MTFSFARSRARRSQLGLIKPVPWEKRGRAAPGEGDRCATKSSRILSCAERGHFRTTDRMSFHRLIRGIMERDWWRYLPCLSAFPCCSTMFRPGIVGGSQLQAKWDFFCVRITIPYHLLSFASTYLKDAKAGPRALPSAVLLRPYTPARGSITEQCSIADGWRASAAFESGRFSLMYKCWRPLVNAPLCATIRHLSVALSRGLRFSTNQVEIR